MKTTLAALLTGHPDDAPAIGAPDREWLDYGGLRRLSAQISAQLHASGIGRSDRVAIVLPNGPEMATAFVTIAQTAVTAPLNPGYREDEYAFYFNDLKAKGLVVENDYDGPAMAAADRAGVHILRVIVGDDDPAGWFDLKAHGKTSLVAELSLPGADDIALILHTSGTTSRPKIVPLLHSNVAASAHNVMTSLDLTAADRCLNIMPLFHIHGLIAAVSASLAAGGSVWCSAGFDGLRFFRFLKEAQPTWYTAVPTMHQAILSRATRNADVTAGTPLRFLRSSSAPLPAQGHGRPDRDVRRTGDRGVWYDRSGASDDIKSVAASGSEARISRY